MGRYYSGDIKGKFWYGVQSSDDANFFGVTGDEPNYLEYCFEQEDLEEVENGIKTCRNKLKGWKRKMNTFFKNNIVYNDNMLIGVLTKDKETNRKLLKWYARLKLGIQIRDCIKKETECNFTAEL